MGYLTHGYPSGTPPGFATPLAALADPFGLPEEQEQEESSDDDNDYENPCYDDYLPF